MWRPIDIIHVIYWVPMPLANDMNCIASSKQISKIKFIQTALKRNDLTIPDVTLGKWPTWCTSASSTSLCIKLVIYPDLYQDARSAKHKIPDVVYSSFGLPPTYIVI